MNKFLFFIGLPLVLSAASAYAQNVSKNLVSRFSSDGYEKDISWVYTASPDGRFIVLGCGNSPFSKKTNVNICNPDISNLQVYDTYEKRIKSIDLSSTFSFPRSKYFAYTFARGSNLVIAELPFDWDTDTIENFALAEYRQKIVNINLNTSLIESEYNSSVGKFCTQLAYFDSQIVCAQNSYRKTAEDTYLNDLDLVFFDTQLSKVIKSTAISKNKSFPMMPQINDTEFVATKSVNPSRKLVISEDLGDNIYTTGDSFSIDAKNGNVQLLPELDSTLNSTAKYSSIVHFVGNFSLNGSVSTLYLISYHSKYNSQDNPPFKTTSQFLAINAKNSTLIDVPKSWGDFNLSHILGVSSDKDGFPIVFRLIKKTHEDESSQLYIKKYSLLTGDESIVFSADYSVEYNKIHFNSGVLWDEASETFFLLNGVRFKSTDDGYEISEIQQVNADGVSIQKTSIFMHGIFYLNPRSSNQVVVEYNEEEGEGLFGGLYSYSAVKRKAILIDKEKFSIKFGDYNAPLVISEKGMVLVSVSSDNSGNYDYSIYYYEY